MLKKKKKLIKFMHFTLFQKEKWKKKMIIKFFTKRRGFKGINKKKLILFKNRKRHLLTTRLINFCIFRCKSRGVIKFFFSGRHNIRYIAKYVDIPSFTTKN